MTSLKSWRPTSGEKERLDRSQVPLILRRLHHRLMSLRFYVNQLSANWA